MRSHSFGRFLVLASAISVLAAGSACATISGTILETMDSGGYTYVKLSTPQGEAWAAVTQAPVKLGEQITVTNEVEMTGFESATLQRRFDRILFGVLQAPAGAPPAAPSVAGQVPAAVSGAHSGLAAGRATLDGAIPRAEGPEGRTVAEIYAEKAQLVDKPVAVRGRVVKFNGGILNRNWIHIQDGTGSEGTGDFDLTVTTAATAAVGDVVLVRGTLHTGRDFGAGYSYSVIVEEATVEK